MSALSAMKWTPQNTTYSMPGLVGGLAGQLEAVAGEVGEVDDRVLLVVVAEHGQPRPEFVLRGLDADTELRLGELPVGAGDRELPDLGHNVWRPCLSGNSLPENRTTLTPRRSVQVVFCSDSIAA
jgi:hypothetical protein